MREARMKAINKIILEDGLEYIIYRRAVRGRQRSEA